MNVKSKKHNNMKNLLKETIETIGVETIEDAALNIEWAKVRYEDYSYDINDRFSLAPDHTKEQAIEFLNKLDFEYNNGYGTQYVYGIIMLKDGEWLERSEYDGSEWWAVCSKPAW